MTSSDPTGVFDGGLVTSSDPTGVFDGGPVTSPDPKFGASDHWAGLCSWSRGGRTCSQAVGGAMKRRENLWEMKTET